MGLDSLGNVATRVPPDRFEAAGIPVPPGQLWAMMLDTKRTWDDLVIRFAADEAQARRILDNHYYQQISSAIINSRWLSWSRLATMRAFLFSVLLVAIAHPGGTAQTRPEPDLEALPFAPRQFVCYRPSGSLTIDGRLDEPSWKAAAWTAPFVDILGDRAPQPRFATRAKMLWDDDYFYFGADLEEPHLWATLTARDSVIFQDNDFEIFIDPDGDTHNYFELEINALATVWDLMLVQPYRDGGPAIHAWDIAGLKAAVNVRGTINRPDDRDDGWSVEIAIPWRIIDEAAPGRRRPKAGERWRVNFSRVQWQVDVDNDRYVKRRNPEGGKPLSEDNWVWSPQGAVNMHMPERWGIVQFADASAGTRTVAFDEDPNDRVAWALRRLYYRQRQQLSSAGRYARRLDALDADAIAVAGLEFKPSMQGTDTMYEISATGFGGAVVHIRQDGKVWLTK